MFAQNNIFKSTCEKRMFQFSTQNSFWSFRTSWQSEKMTVIFFFLGLLFSKEEYV